MQEGAAMVPVVERNDIGGLRRRQFTALIGAALRSDGRQPLNAAARPGRAGKGVSIGGSTGRVRNLADWDIQGGLDSGKRAKLGSGTLYLTSYTRRQFLRGGRGYEAAYIYKGPPLPSLKQSFEPPLSQTARPSSLSHQATRNTSTMRHTIFSIALAALAQFSAALPALDAAAVAPSYVAKALRYAKDDH